MSLANNLLSSGKFLSWLNGLRCGVCDGPPEGYEAGLNPYLAGKFFFQFMNYYECFSVPADIKNHQYTKVQRYLPHLIINPFNKIKYNLILYDSNSENLAL